MKQSRHHQHNILFSRTAIRKWKNSLQKIYYDLPLSINDGLRLWNKQQPNTKEKWMKEAGQNYGKVNETSMFTWLITSMNIWKNNHNKACNTNYYSSYFLESVLCAQEKPCKNHNTRDWPTVQQHDTCDRCVLIGLHHCPWMKMRSIIISMSHFNNHNSLFILHEWKA